MVPTPNLKKDTVKYYETSNNGKIEEFYHELYLLCGSHQILFPK